jgi:hypothetical protein
MGFTLLTEGRLPRFQAYRTTASFRQNKKNCAKLYFLSKIAPKIEVYCPIELHNLVSKYERETREAMWR